MSHHKVRTPSSKLQSGLVKWRAFLPVFLLVVLIFATANGFIKTVSFKRSLGQSWDGVSSFAVVVDGSKDSLFIFQKDPVGAVHVVAGDIFGGENSQTILKKSSIFVGSQIKNYIGFGDYSEIDFSKKFDEFKSYGTPIKILTNGFTSDTNISRIDALKLWWQLKNVRTKDIEVMNIEPLRSSGDKQVLGITSDSTSRTLSPYFENINILKENIAVEIVNASGDLRASRLFENFISSVGGHVTAISGDTNIASQCTIATSLNKSYTARYLEKEFGCDIKETAFDGSRDVLTITIGQDFAEHYFE